MDNAKFIFTDAIKDPDETLDYQWDFTAWLKGDTILTASFLISPTGLTIENYSNTTTTATAWLSGGTDGTIYDVTCRILTVGGRECDRTGQIICQSM